MLGYLDPKDKKVTVIGAGISGLLIAYSLKKRGFEVTVHEASSRVGGLIETKQTEFGMVETAAHSLMVTAEAKILLGELGVELVPVNKNSLSRFIYRSQKMRRMPLRFFELLLTLVRFFSKPKLQFNQNSSSLADWCLSYLGRPALDYLLSPFVTGIFAATPSELNAKIVFPQLIPNRVDISLFSWFQKNKRSQRPVMMAPKKGMSFVVHQLEKELQGNIRLNSPINSLENISGNLILAVPTHALSKLISKEDPESAELLLQVRYAPLISATCFYAVESFHQRPPRGVGVLIPRNEGLKMLGCLFNSSSFPYRTAKENMVSVTVMYGGTTDLEVLALSKSELSQLIAEEMKTLFPKLSSSPDHIEITHWPRAIPVFSNQLKAAQESLLQGFCLKNGQLVFTNYSKSVSIRSLIDAVHYL